VIEHIVKPKVLNLTSSKIPNVLECYIKDNSYEQVAVRWEIMDNGIPGLNKSNSSKMYIDGQTDRRTDGQTEHCPDSLRNTFWKDKNYDRLRETDRQIDRFVY
jgi:hypothetical protein